MKSHWQLWGRLYCKQVNTLTALHQLLSAAVHRLHLCLFEWWIVTGTIQTFFKCANLDCETCPTETFWCIVFHCHHYFLFSFLPAMTVSSAANVFTLWVCVCVYVYVCVCVCVCVCPGDTYCNTEAALTTLPGVLCPLVGPWTDLVNVISSQPCCCAAGWVIQSRNITGVHSRSKWGPSSKMDVDSPVSTECLHMSCLVTGSSVIC